MIGSFLGCRTVSQVASRTFAFQAPRMFSAAVPGYLAKADELKAKGVSDVIVYCVNDGAVMEAWAKDQKIEGSIITFLADTKCELTSALGLVLDAPGAMDVLGNKRCQRFSMLLEDGVIKTLNVAAGDDSVTFVDQMLKDL